MRVSITRQQVFRVFLGVLILLNLTDWVYAAAWLGGHPAETVAVGDSCLLNGCGCGEHAKGVSCCCRKGKVQNVPEEALLAIAGCSGPAPSMPLSFVSKTKITVFDLDCFLVVPVQTGTCALEALSIPEQLFRDPPSPIPRG